MYEDTFYALACATILSGFIIFLAGYFSWWVSKHLTKKATASKRSNMVNSKSTYLRQEYLNSRHQGMR